jgi:DNA sulfur modification protein DndC
MMDERTIQLFSIDELVFSIEERIERALAAIVAIFMQQIPAVIAFSGGKDSSVVAALTLHAAMQAKERGATPFIVATTSDTEVENPEISVHYRAELAKMRAFGRRHGLNIQTDIARPNLLSTFQMTILTGRGLPSFPNVSSDCSVSRSPRKPGCASNCSRRSLPAACRSQSRCSAPDLTSRCAAPCT